MKNESYYARRDRKNSEMLDMVTCGRIWVLLLIAFWSFTAAGALWWWQT